MGEAAVLYSCAGTSWRSAVATISQATGASAGIDRAHRRVILASSLGAIFEWYDFFLYGALASVFSKQFFQGVNETTSFIFALLAFAAGFAVRPFGALVFGRLGDLAGRKYTFLITIVLMGVSTALLGLLPTYTQVGVLAPILLIALRLLQGLAMGGEYGGAAVYVAEHAPRGQRGYYTSWIQTTGTIGLALSLAVVLSCRLLFGEHFDTWGWRVPFLLSIVLLAISVYIRLQLEESPVFKDMQRENKLSRRPVGESLGTWANVKVILLALFGVMSGQAVIGYVSMVYVLFFLTQALKVDAIQANVLVVGALLLAAPLNIVFGRLSDRIGRKPVFMSGCVLAVFLLFPLFQALTHFANPATATAREVNPVVVVADPRECSFQFDPVGKARFTSSCDVAKSALARVGVPYSNESAAPGSVAFVRVGEARVASFPGSELPAAEFQSRSAAFRTQLDAALAAAGYPQQADPARMNAVMVFLLLFLLSVFAVLTYAPVAAWLVELFPPRIRYTSMSCRITSAWDGSAGFCRPSHSPSPRTLAISMRACGTR